MGNRLTEPQADKLAGHPGLVMCVRFDCLAESKS